MNKANKYLYNYPQLSLGIQEGMSQSEEYRNIVRKGIMPDKLAFPFELSGEEDEYTIDTPAGEVSVLYLPDRAIFEYFIIASLTPLNILSISIPRCCNW